MNQFSNILAAVKAYEANRWELGDQLLVDLGQPPQSLAKCERIIAEEFDMARDNDHVREWAKLWRTAAAFPPSERQPVGLSVHTNAGNPYVLALVLAGWRSKPNNSNALRPKQIERLKRSLREVARIEARNRDARS